MKRHVLVLSSVALLTLAIVSCSNPKELSLVEKLENIEGISGIKEFTPKEKVEGIKSFCAFKMKQYVDWDQKEGATFNQQACIYYVSDTAPTEYFVNGYYIYQGEPKYLLDMDEFFKRYTCNVVMIEYRFFNTSIPEGFDPLGTKYYEYMTSYQASKDFYHIISSLKTFLTGPTIFTGASKGGYATEAMAYYYPNDIDAYVSYVAPLCESDHDLRLFEYIYTNIGDKGLPIGEGKKKRDIITAFQKKALDEKFRYKIKSYLPKKEFASIEELSEEEIYEAYIANFPIGVWQILMDFENITNILNMKEDTEEEIDEKAFMMAKRIDTNSSRNSDDDPDKPYHIQAKLEMGNYAINLDYLRDSGMNIKTKKERDIILMDYLTLKSKQINTFKFDPSFHNEMVKFLDTTDKEIIKIVGLLDPWYAVKDPVTQNKNIHLFEVNNNHRSRINELDESKRNEAWSIIDRLVNKTNNNY